jgi:hypothetical protein
MCTIIRPPPTWSDGHRRRGWVWTRFYLVPPPPPSFGDDASSINYPISNEDESPTIESVVFVVSGLLMCLNVCTLIIFDEMPKMNSCTCFRMYFRKARLDQRPISIMEKMGTPVRYMAIAALDRIECFPTSEQWIPSFISPIVTMPFLRRFATISNVMLMVLFPCCARETGEF